MTDFGKKRGIVLFAHGSRDPAWKGPIEAVAGCIAKTSPQTPVVCAYLELMQPDLATAISMLAQEQAQTITVVPLFLGLGKHAREDLPRLVANLQLDHPQVRIVLKRAVGEEQRLVGLLAQMALDED